MDKITFRTKADAMITVAERKIGTIGAWVQHEVEVGVELLTELRDLVDEGTAIVQGLKPNGKWSEDMTAEQLQKSIDAITPAAQVADNETADAKKAKAPKPEAQA